MCKKTQDTSITVVSKRDPFQKRAEYALKAVLLRLLKWLGPKSSPPTQPLNASSKVLFIRLNRIGDALISTAFIHAIKDSAGCTIHVYGDVKNRFIFDGHPDIDKVYAYRKKLSDFWQFRAICRREKYDAVVDLHDDVSTTVTYLVALSGAPYRIGLARPRNKQVFTHPYPRLNTATTHVIDRQLELAHAFGLTLQPEDVNVYYPILAQNTAQAAGFIAKSFPQRRFLVGVNLSAGSPARFWGEANFAQLVQYLTAQGAQVIMLGLPSDKERAGRIAPSAPLYLNPDFNGFSAIIPQLNLLFTPDTSLVHVASAYHVPVFGLYVFSNPNLMYWYPYRSRYVAYTTAQETLAGEPFEAVWALLQPFLLELMASKAGV